MSEEASHQPFRVRGERVPLWLPWGLALLGLVGSLVSASLLLSDWRNALQPPSGNAEIDAGATPEPSNERATRSGEIPDAKDSSDERQEQQAEEVEHPAAATSRGTAEQTSVRQRPLQLPARQTAVPKLEPADNAAAKASETRGFDVHIQPEEGASGRQVDSDSDLEADEEQPVATATDATHTRAVSTANTNVEADAARRKDVALDSRSTPVAPVQVTAGADSIGLGAAGSEPHGAQMSQPEATESIGNTEARGLSRPRIGAQLKADRVRRQLRAQTDSEQRSVETAIDCAPLFSVDFDHGSIKPQGKNTEQKIEPLANWLRTHPRAIVYVDGHADPSGPEEVNLIVSFRRAVAIAALIEEAGASKAQLVVRAYGEHPSLLPSTEPQAERRVTLVMGGPVRCGNRVSFDGGPR